MIVVRVGAVYKPLRCTGANQYTGPAYIGKVCIIAVGNMANAVRPADSEHPVFSRCVRGKPI